MSLLNLLTRLKSASNRDEINLIIVDLEQEIKSSFLSLIARNLKNQSDFSPDRMVDEAEDLLQQALLKFYMKSDRFRGRSEAEAESYVHQILTRTFLDAVKTPTRRNSIWRHWLLGWKKSNGSEKL